MSLVGRASELERTRAVLERGLAGQASLILFSGEAGIGKTSLADALVAAATERGANVAWGRCWEAGGAPAYWPWTEVFRALGDVDPFAHSVETSPAEAQQTRFRMFERAAEILRAAARERPLVVVLDDLHASDVPSLLFLHLVARGLRAGGKLVIVGTYRDAEARLAAESFALLAKIGREGDVLELGRLKREDVIAWMKQEQPNATDDVATRVHEVTEGNPLFVHEVLRSRRAQDTAQVPDGLRAILDQHVARVSPELRELLSVASVFGREATNEDIAALTARSVDEVAAKMKDARDAGLVVFAAAGAPAAGAPRSAPGGAAGRHAFAHMLIREHLYGDLSAMRRAELHASCGERLAAQGDVEGAAHHLFQGSGPAARTAIVARDAALRATARLAFEDAADLAKRALAILTTELSDSPLACELEIVLAESLIRMGQSAPGKQAAVRAAEMAEHLGWPRLLAQAALVYGAELTSVIVDPTMVSLLRSALAALPASDDPLRARVMIRLAAALVPPTRRDEVSEILALARDGVAMARRLADPETLLYTLRFAAVAAGYLVSAEERFGYARGAMELATTLDRPVVRVEMGALWTGTLRERGMRDESARALDDYLRLIREFPQPHYQWRPPLVLAANAMLDGDFERSDRLAQESFAVAEAGAAFPGMLCWALARTASALLRPDPRSLAGDVDRVLALFGRLPKAARFAEVMGAITLAVVGRVPEARARLTDPPIEEANYPNTILLARLAVLLDDKALGAQLFEPLAGMCAANPIFWSMHCTGLFGPAAHVAGDVAVMLGRVDEARVLLDAGLRQAELMYAPGMIASVRRSLDALGAAPSA